MQCLKEAREKAGYTVADVSSHLKIRSKYIIAIEEERYEELTSSVYLDGYIKMYKKFLHIEEDDNAKKQVSTVDKLINNKQSKQTKNQRHPDIVQDYQKYSNFFILVSAIILIISTIIYNAF